MILYYQTKCWKTNRICFIIKTNYSEAGPRLMVCIFNLLIPEWYIYLFFFLHIIIASFLPSLYRIFLKALEDDMLVKACLRPSWLADTNLWTPLLVPSSSYGLLHNYDLQCPLLPTTDTISICSILCKSLVGDILAEGIRRGYWAGRLYMGQQDQEEGNITEYYPVAVCSFLWSWTLDKLPHLVRTCGIFKFLKLNGENKFNKLEK